MTSHELARQLLEGPDVEVLISSDEEGNEIRPFAGPANSMGFKHHVEKFSGGWDEYILTHPLDEEEYEPEEWAARQPFVVLWP